MLQQTVPAQLSLQIHMIPAPATPLLPLSQRVSHEKLSQRGLPPTKHLASRQLEQRQENQSRRDNFALDKWPPTVQTEYGSLCVIGTNVTKKHSKRIFNGRLLRCLHNGCADEQRSVSVPERVDQATRQLSSCVSLSKECLLFVA